VLSGVNSSCIRLGHGLGHAARWVSRFERRTPITPRIRAGLEPLGRHDRGGTNTSDLSADTAEANQDLWAAAGETLVARARAHIRGTARCPLASRRQANRTHNRPPARNGMVAKRVGRPGYTREQTRASPGATLER
jgi:hypothetical protein